MKKLFSLDTIRCLINQRKNTKNPIVIHYNFRKVGQSFLSTCAVCSIKPFYPMVLIFINQIYTTFVVLTRLCFTFIDIWKINVKGIYSLRLNNTKCNIFNTSMGDRLTTLRQHSKQTKKKISYKTSKLSIGAFSSGIWEAVINICNFKISRTKSLIRNE